MPFNIELSISEPIAIKIQVVKSTLTAYFSGADDEAYARRDDWNDLSQSFVTKLSQYEPVSIEKDIRIEVYHQKKDHTTEQERKVPHLHLHHRIEINPDMFAEYLLAFYQHQCEAGPQYQFFRDIEEIHSIIARFKEYYVSYKGSSIERYYEEETKLTAYEVEEHVDEIIRLTIQDAEVRKVNRNVQSVFLFFGGMETPQTANKTTKATSSFALV